MQEEYGRWVTYSLNPDSVVLDYCTRRAEQDNAAILETDNSVIYTCKSRFDTYCRVVDSVISDKTVLATDADTIRPLLEGIRATRPDVVVLHGGIVAGERALSDVEARPAAGIEGANVFDELTRIAATHFNIGAATGG